MTEWNWTDAMKHFHNDWLKQPDHDISSTCKSTFYSLKAAIYVCVSVIVVSHHVF